jgi:hypothetical protein
MVSNFVFTKYYKIIFSAGVAQLNHVSVFLKFNDKIFVEIVLKITQVILKFRNK